MLAIVIDWESTCCDLTSLTRLEKSSMCSFGNRNISENAARRVSSKIFDGHTCNVSNSFDARYSDLARLIPSFTKAATVMILAISAIASAMT